MRRFQHSLLGGLFIGVLSALPVVNLANWCCCLWVVLGGLLTAYLQKQNQPEPLEAGEVAIGGLLAGLIGAVIWVVLAAALLSLSGEAIEGQIREAILNSPEIPTDVRDRIMELAVRRNIILLIAAVSLPVYAFFGMLGSLLGLAIFKKTAPPPPSPE